MKKPRAKTLVRLLVSVAMVAVGLAHFFNPEPFVRIVPSVLPAPLALVYISGVFEILGGLGLLWLRSRRAASLGLVALYVAVFPANINMALNEIQLEVDGDMAVWKMWARLPLQAVFIAVAYWVGRPERRER